ncbi:MAG: metal ABC transporter ATP-binding protein [Thermomicrobiales bacterium]
MAARVQPLVRDQEAAVAVHDLTVAYRETPVLWDVDVVIPTGTLTAIIGPNGAGKSTFIKAVLGLVPVAAGTVEIFGHTSPRQRKLVGYVPQRGSVDWSFPTNVLDVVTMGTYGQLGWVRRPGKQEKAQAMHALEQVGMADYANRQISQLSGGQQQRVFLARALVQDQQLYFMDEPFAGVDAATEKAIVGILQQLREQGKTVIVVHHDLESAPDYFDGLVLLNVRLIKSGPFAETFTAENLSLTYGGNLNLLKPRMLPAIEPHVPGEPGMQTPGEMTRQARNDGGAAHRNGVSVRGGRDLVEKRA